ncbi:MAG TPA: hypothetical protein VK253_03030 [Candidatus Binatia bacterium]|nr:hypothetical protein [Candidatus Binatia bacterium]
MRENPISKILTIVPCGQSKIWKNNPKHGPERAGKAYIGAPFIVNKKFAKKFSNKWLILSAKYGFLEPSFKIEDYNVTFKKPSTNPISINTLKKQAHAQGITHYDIVIALGGKDYSARVREVFINGSRVFAPAVGYLLELV